ncbi:hypothetical protein HS088_TW13G00172 [Tripterygium wilfordii]|uniref:Uncharacterized protein n=1 Tax=Tripterygium wilfordii TaxID=458696 RepID=A0A7J7CT74_TRIWF|nr:hypothetical protein HS088_TW13G00172 [Tripterygium wilfordii]
MSFSQQQSSFASEKEMKSMDEIGVVLRRFGDEQSTLLDRFERLSFEVQLNQAILNRSFSEPAVGRFQPPLVTQEVQQGRRSGFCFRKVLKKLLKPIFGRKSNKNCGCHGSGRIEVSDPKDWKVFSRSVRL